MVATASDIGEDKRANPSTFAGRAFDPELVKAMTTTFEEALRELKLSNREDPITQTVARIIIECAERGIRDPVAMRGCVMEALRT